MTRRLSRRALGLAAIAVGALTIAGLFPIHNDDAFGHLAQGRQIAELGYVPAVDTLSFWRDTPQPWRNYEWGSDLIFWAIFSLAGPNGLLIFKALLLGLTAALLLRRAADFRRARELTVSITAALLIWAIPASRFRLTMRPELFGYCLAALYLVGLGRLAGGRLGARARWGWIAGLILTHVLWVNLHGSHLLGLTLAVGHLATLAREPAPRRDLLLVVGGFALACCVSPYGPTIVTDAVVHVADPVYREVVREWAPWSEDHPLLLLVALIVGAILLVAAAIPLHRAGPSERAALFCAAILAVLGFRSVRFVATFVLLSAPLLAAGLSRLARASLRGRAELGAVAGVGVSLVAAAALTPGMPPDQGIGLGIDESEQPVVAGRVLEDELGGGRVLAPMQTSWYLMYASPSSRFLIDGRVPFYGPAHVAEVNRGLRLPDALAPLLTRYGVDVLVLGFASSETQVALLELTRIDGFYPISIENDYVLFAARVPGREATIDRRAFQALPTRLDPSPLLAPDAPVQAMRAEIARLEATRSTSAIVAWYRGVLAMRPLSRGVDAGFAAPSDEVERAAAARAEALLSRAAEHYDTIPIVHAYHALAAVAACQPELARRAAERAGVDGQNREALLAQTEAALRAGDEAPARQLLEAAAADPRAAADPWLGALRRDVEARIRCP